MREKIVLFLLLVTTMSASLDEVSFRLSIVSTDSSGHDRNRIDGLVVGIDRD